MEVVAELLQKTCPFSIYSGGGRPKVLADVCLLVFLKPLWHTSASLA